MKNIQIQPDGQILVAIDKELLFDLIDSRIGSAPEFKSLYDELKRNINKNIIEEEQHIAENTIIPKSSS